MNAAERDQVITNLSSFVLRLNGAQLEMRNVMFSCRQITERLDALALDTAALLAYVDGLDDQG